MMLQVFSSNKNKAGFWMAVLLCLPDHNEKDDNMNNITMEYGWRQNKVLY